MPLEWQDLSQEDQNQVVSTAQIYYLDHKEHVTKTVLCSHPYFVKIAPSGSDLYHPELWKGCHWNWFFAGGEDGPTTCEQCEGIGYIRDVVFAPTCDVCKGTGVMKEGQ